MIKVLKRNHEKAGTYDIVYTEEHSLRLEIGGKRYHIQETFEKGVVEINSEEVMYITPLASNHIRIKQER